MCRKFCFPGSLLAVLGVQTSHNRIKNSRCPKTSQTVLQIYNCVLLILFLNTAKYQSLLQHHHLGDMKLQRWHLRKLNPEEFWVQTSQNSIESSRCPKTCQTVLKIYNCVLLVLFLKTAKYQSLVNLLSYRRFGLPSGPPRLAPI